MLQAKKKNNNKRRKRRPRERRVPVQTFRPKMRFRRMRYFSAFNSTNATTVASNNRFSMNGPFAPIVSGSGAAYQPYEWDNAALLYNRYRVDSVQWKIVYGGSTGTVHVGAGPTNGNYFNSITNLATFDAACADPYTKSKVVTLNGNTEVITGSCNLAKLNGVTREEYKSDDRFSSLSSTVPAEVMNLNVFVYNPGGSSITNSLAVEIFYNIEFYDHILQSQSTFSAQEGQSFADRLVARALLLRDKERLVQEINKQRLLQEAAQQYDLKAKRL